MKYLWDLQRYFHFPASFHFVLSVISFSLEPLCFSDVLVSVCLPLCVYLDCVGGTYLAHITQNKNK